MKEISKIYIYIYNYLERAIWFLKEGLEKEYLWL